MSTQARIAIFAVLLALTFWSGWTTRGWRDGANELSRLNSAVARAWQVQADLNAILAKLAEERADQLAKFNKLDKDLANYVKNPNRTKCSFDADRVRVKTEAANAANGVAGSAR